VQAVRVGVIPDDLACIVDGESLGVLGGQGVLNRGENIDWQGPATTTKCVRIRAWIISRRTNSWLKQQDQRPAMQRAGALRQMGPPRPGPLLNRPLGDNCS